MLSKEECLEIEREQARAARTPIICEVVRATRRVVKTVIYRARLTCGHLVDLAPSEKRRKQVRCIECEDGLG